ncbi:MAG TPA: hypothetical protein VJ802_01365 [Gemmatimonadaceae bacterium]|nr:hypothetical protein [Gemmatimonadaceae bacterium]
MSRLPAPDVAWQLTGNHWLALPCIDPSDGSLRALSVLHRGARAAVEIAGAPEFLRGDGPPLLRPTLRVDGAEKPLGAVGLAWERALEWIPTFTATIDSLLVRGTLFAPHGRDADVAGAVFALAIDNRGSAAARVEVTFEGTLGHRQIRVRSPRAADDAHVVTMAPDGVVLLEGAALPGLAAVAIAAGADAQVSVGDGRFAIRQDMTIPASGRAHAAVYLAVGPERDGACATVAVMRRRGWSELLAATRDALRSLEQTVGHEGIDRLVNTNLLFAYFYGVGRAIDDGHLYLVRSRAPWNGRGVTVRDWEALSWTLPAVLLADAPLARELLLRACEVLGYVPGEGLHYFDGTMFEPGFTLEGLAAYALATDRYIRATNDDQIVEEPILAETLYVSSEDLTMRRDAEVPLYSTEILPSGVAAPLPYTLHGNAVVARMLEVLRRTLDEETANRLEEPDAVRAALMRHFVTDKGGKPALASAIDLDGHTADADDPIASAYWLPLYDAFQRDDSLYRRTVRGVATAPEHLAHQCARLMGPDAADVLRWLRRAPLDHGLGAEFVDADGRATANGGDATLSGLVAWSVWYAVHALGLRP